MPAIIIDTGKAGVARNPIFVAIFVDKDRDKDGDKDTRKKRVGRSGRCYIAAIPPGWCLFAYVAGGIATLNHRLMAGKPPACLESTGSLRDVGYNEGTAPGMVDPEEEHKA